MIKIYHYFGRFGKEFFSILETHKIKYQVSYAPSDPEPIYSFDLKCPSSNFDNQYAAVSLYVKPIDIRAEYTKADLSKAALIAIRPKRQCVSVLNYEEAMLHYCSTPPYNSGCSYIHDQEQVDLLQIDRLPKRTKTAFFSEDTGFEFLFCDKRAYNVLCSSNICGVEFKPVLSKNKKVYPDFYQITSDNKISREIISLGHSERYDYCPICGAKKIVLNNTDQLHLNMKQLGEESDFYVTESIFGEGAAYPLYIISQHCFELLKDNDLIYHLVLTPLVCE